MRVIVVIAGILILFLANPLILPARAEVCYTNETNWDNLGIGCRVYAYLVDVPEAVYLAPDEGANRLVNGPVVQGWGSVNDHYPYLNPGAVFWLEKVDETWVKIVKNRRQLAYTGDFESVYAQNRFFEIIPPVMFEPIGRQHNPDLLLVVTVADPALYVFDGTELMLKSPAYVSSALSDRGDFRATVTTVSYDMPGGLYGVPDFLPYNSGGDGFHGAPWRDFSQSARGGYGTNGCINLPGHEWYEIPYRGQMLSVTELVWKMVTANNRSLDPTDQEQWMGSLDYTGRVYQAVDAARVIVVDTLGELHNHPLTKRLGGEAQSATVEDWNDVIMSGEAAGDDWVLPEFDLEGNYSGQSFYSGELAKAEIFGGFEENPYVMLQCNQVAEREKLAYPGSSRTVGQVCDHLQFERQGSVCTPERVDEQFFGRRVLCDADKFNALPFDYKIELRMHENVHLVQFGGFMGEMVRDGVAAADDLSPNYIDPYQDSLVGITELRAQMENDHWRHDYDFTLVRGRDGEREGVRSRASLEDAWLHLHQECGDPSGVDPGLDDLLMRGLLDDQQAYLELENRCTLPPHQLIPDRTR